MVLSNDQVEALKSSVLDKEDSDLSFFDNLPKRPSSNAVKDPKKRWPRGEVRYRFDSKLARNEQDKIRRNLRVLGSKLSGCIKFIEETSPTGIFVTNKNKGCYSQVGYIGREYTLNLQSRGCMSDGTIQHEFLHALGLYHHQSRSDRDQYIKIIEGNIENNRRSQFNKYGRNFINSYGLPYDYNSVMHYHDTAFGKKDRGRSRTTIQTLDGSYQDTIGQRGGASDGDIELVKRAYGCKEGYPTFFLL